MLNRLFSSDLLLVFAKICPALLLILTCLSKPVLAQNGVTVAGGNPFGMAPNQVWRPSGIFTDGNGYLYVTDLSTHLVKKFPPDGTSATSGTVVAGGNGFGSAANQLSAPADIYVDGSGYMYVADQNNNRIQRFPPNSTSATAGITVAGGNGQGLAANQFWNPTSVTIQPNGYMYVLDRRNNRVQQFPPNSNQSSNGTTVAGGNGNGTAANQFNFPYFMFFDGNGNLYVSEYLNNRIQKFPPNSTQATNGVTVAGGNGYGSAANQLNNPQQGFVDASGNIYVVDGGNYRLQKFPPNGTSATNGVTVAGGNGNGASANQLYFPTGISIDGSGNIYVADNGNNRIQRFPPTTTQSTNATTVAGGNGYSRAPNQLEGPSDVFIDASDNLYVIDRTNNRIQKFPPNSTSATAGTTVAGGNGQGSAANQINTAYGLVVDAAGNLLVADRQNSRIQKFPPNSTQATNAITIAGATGGGSGPTQLYLPNDVLLDVNGNLLVVDQFNQRVQKFPPNSTTATAGITVAGGNGLGGAANQFYYPLQGYVDANGNLYVADGTGANHRIQKFPPNSTTATVGITVAGGNGSGSAANQLSSPAGVVVDGSGNIYVADYGNNRIQKFPPNSTSATVGITVGGGNGSGSAANQLYSPRGISLDSYGNLYVADETNQRVQRFDIGSGGPIVTLKSGDWNDTTVWSCTCVPVVGSVISVRHAVTIPVNYLALAKQVIYTSQGQLVYATEGRLQLVP